MFRTTLLAILALLLGPTAAVSETRKVEFKTSGFAQADFDKALEAFRTLCKPLGTSGWSDVVEVQGEFFDEYAAHRRAKGWTKTLSLRIKLANPPLKLPASDDRVGVVGGHVLYFDIGGGKEPGVFSSKRVSQFVCGFPISAQGSDVFTPDPAFAFLTR
ncbi:hypothetical protein [Azorhizobium caulinodans]|uniref:hypothetical protein n=1 Tax=Azorhizobium caulinodans TaxID=7 RepID=UPI002FBE8C8A